MKKTFIALFIMLSTAVSSFAFEPELQIGKKVKFDYIGQFYLGSPIMDGDFYRINPSKSSAFFWDLASLKISLDQNKQVYFRAAMRYRYNNIGFGKDITLVEENGHLIEMPLVVNDLKKTKLNMNYISLPLGICFDIKRAEIQLNYTADFLVGARTKYKYAEGKKKTEIYEGLSPFVNTIEAMVGYRNCGVLVNYSLTPTFKKGSFGDEAHMVTIGLCYGF